MAIHFLRTALIEATLSALEGATDLGDPLLHGADELGPVVVGDGGPGGESVQRMDCVQCAHCLEVPADLGGGEVVGLQVHLHGGGWAGDGG